MENNTVYLDRKYRHASKVIIHPDYSFLFTNNIAIIFVRILMELAKGDSINWSYFDLFCFELKISKPFMRTSSFGPIRLPDRDISDDINCSVGKVEYFSVFWPILVVLICWRAKILY